MRGADQIVLPSRGFFPLFCSFDSFPAMVERSPLFRVTRLGPLRGCRPLFLLLPPFPDLLPPPEEIRRRVESFLPRARQASPLLFPLFIFPFLISIDVVTPCAFFSIPARFARKRNSASFSSRSLPLGLFSSYCTNRHEKSYSRFFSENNLP